MKINLIIILMVLGTANILKAQYGVKGDLTKKPNILFIFSDDHSSRAVGVLGNPVIKTPTLDSLANAGIIFTNMYNQGANSSAVCKVTRLMLNTGRYYEPNNTPLTDSVPYWGQSMKALGYKTYESGKWHNGNAMVEASFDKYLTTSGCACVEDTTKVASPYYRPYGQGGTAENPMPNGNSWLPTNTYDGHYSSNVNFKTGLHSTEAISNQALQFLKEHKEGPDSDKPYFMYLAYNAPHDFRQAPQKYQDMYPYESIDFTPSYMEEHFNTGTSWTLRDEKLGNYPRDSTIYRQQRSEYYAIISHMDDHIRMVLDSVEALGLLENTYVIYTTDHGLAAGEHAMLGKQNLYEHSTKVPFFIAGPGITPGTQSEALFYLHNIYATSVEIAGGTPPASMNFQSVVDNINQPQNKGRENLYFRYLNNIRGVRTEFYKILVYNTSANKVQLFRLKSAPNAKEINDFADPYEIRDLSDNPEYSQILSGMLYLLDQKMEEIGDALTYPSEVEAYRLDESQSLLLLPKDTEQVSTEFNGANPFDSKIVKIHLYNTKGKLLGEVGDARNWEHHAIAQGLPKGLYILKYVYENNAHQLSKRILY